ncbi:MAG: cell division transport system permease protein [Frankiaceae bacterium]|jgi:cell division transport system permease protein|nr:cell division transport system permease protein [Frankiaceae bacterium]
MRIRPIVRDAGLGLRRNLTMTFAVVLCSAVSLALLGAGLLLQRQVDITSNALFGRVELNIYLTDDVTPDQQQALAERLAADPAVDTFVFETQEQAFERAKRLYADSPGLLDGLGPDVAPAAFHAKLVHPQDFARVADSYRNVPGVDSVPDLRKLLDSFFRWLDGFKLAAFVLAVVQGFATLVLLYNTVRVSAHTRRRETSIMRLVGASNAYIRAPFVLESAAAGLLGGLLASASMVALYGVLVRRVFSRQHFTPLITGGDVVRVSLLALAAGVLLSSAMAWVALRRHLKAADPSPPRRRATDRPDVPDTAPAIAAQREGERPAVATRR